MGNHIRYIKEQMGLLATDDRSHSAAAFHSSYLIMLVSAGPIGFLLFFVLVWQLFKQKEMHEYGVFLGVMALFDNVLLYGMIAVIMATIAVTYVSRPLRR